MRLTRLAGSCLVVIATLVAMASNARSDEARAFGDTRIFARVRDPGQPAGIAVYGKTVLVTSLGLATQPLTDPGLFTFDLDTAAHTGTISIPRMMPASVMALYGVSGGPDGRVYVADMNGRVLRIDLNSGSQDVYSEFPSAVGGMTTMPFDIVFDDAGYAYVTDQNLAGIWRVPPGGGSPVMWFQDPHLASYLFGPTGIRLDLSRKNLYFTVARSHHPATADLGIVFRLPIDDPSPSQLTEVFRYPARSSAWGIEVGASGRLYVALAGPSQLSVLSPQGTEISRFPTSEENARRQVPFDRPLGLALNGQGSLLVTNSNALSVPDPARMVVFDVYVDDVGAAPAPSPTHQIAETAPFGTLAATGSRHHRTTGLFLLGLSGLAALGGLVSGKNRARSQIQNS